MVDTWPDVLATEIARRFGGHPDVVGLGGMSGSEVVRLSRQGRTAILKRSTNAREYDVYTRLAPILATYDVRMPDLYAAHHETGDTETIIWLLLEDIPHPLPRNRWHADTEMLAMLRRLHGIPNGAAIAQAGHYAPGWDTAMTNAALSLFPTDDGNRLTRLLTSLHDRSAFLFTPTCLLSGDPNPANWGCRDDGSLVLFDWERCCPGDAAIDLAITVPGLGDDADFRATAACYLSLPEKDPAVARLAERMRIAKVWSVTEFLAGVAAGQTQSTFSIDNLLGQVRSWLLGMQR